MNTKKFYSLFFIGIILLGVCLVFVPQSKSQQWENQYGRLEVNPDISFSPVGKNKQYWNCQIYINSQNMDFAFAFNDPLLNGSIYQYNDNGTSIKMDVEHIIYNDKHFYVLENLFMTQNKTYYGFWEYQPSVKSGKWDMYIKRSSDSLQYAMQHNLYVHLDPWFNNNWEYRKLIVLNTSLIESGYLNNFVVPINIIDTDLKDFAQDDADDIAFVDYYDNTTQFYHEIEYYDDTTGHLYAWVNDTNISTSNNKFWMYFGNVECNSQQNITSTWDNHYIFVHHLKDLDNSHVTDSTINDIDGTKISTNNPLEVTESIYYKSQYYASTGKIDLGSSSKFAVKNLTVEQWFNLDNYHNADLPILSHDNYGGDGCINSVVLRSGSGSANKLYNRVYVTNSNYAYVISPSVVPLDTWLFNTFTFDGETLTMFINKSIQGTDTETGDLGDTADNLLIGDKYHTGYWDEFDGFIDEVRMSDVVRNREYINMTYDSIMNCFNGGFFSIDTIEYKPVDNFIITDIYPVNNSAIDCLNISQLSVTINSSAGSTSGWVNISLNNSFYNNVSFTGNNTYILNVSTFNFTVTPYTSYIWYVNCSNENIITNQSWFTFICISGCPCYDEFMILNYKIDQILEGLDGSDEMEIEFGSVTLSIFLTLVLFFFCFWIGYTSVKRSGGAFMFLSGFILLSFEGLTVLYLDAFYIMPLLTPFSIFIMMLGIRKWLYPFEGERNKSEGE